MEAQLPQGLVSLIGVGLSIEAKLIVAISIVHLGQLGRGGLTRHKGRLSFRWCNKGWLSGLSLA